MVAIKNNVGKLLIFMIPVVLLFTVAAQSSNDLIMWLNPDHVSTSDEKYFYTLIPAFICLLVSSVLAMKVTSKSKLKATALVGLLIFNVALFVYYVYYQYIFRPGGWELF
jgi:uncharacterized membrane protein YGL010W